MNTVHFMYKVVCNLQFDQQITLKVILMVQYLCKLKILSCWTKWEKVTQLSNIQIQQHISIILNGPTITWYIVNSGLQKVSFKSDPIGGRYVPKL